jgi:hypothetical protein
VATGCLTPDREQTADLSRRSVLHTHDVPNASHCFWVITPRR